MMATKVAILGDANGQLSVVFKKVASLQAKNPFAFAIVAGNLFAEPDRSTEADDEDLVKLLEGKIEVPLPTYFALGKRPLPDSVVQKLKANGGEVCPNLFVLGRNVSIKTSEGVRIVAIGGAYTGQEDESLAEYAPYHTDKDINRAKEYQNADILITADWPEGLRNGSRLATSYANGDPPVGDRSIAELCMAIKPRFHFSTSSAFFEREPFFHPGDKPLPITRFLSLAPWGNAYKQKYIYGFTLAPGASPPQELPSACTVSPLTSLKKRRLPSQENTFSGYRFQQQDTVSGDHYRPNNHAGKKQRRGLQEPPRPCYFCLVSDNVAEHMVASIGNYSYLTTSKGPLTLNTSFPDLSMHSHMLIIPQEHNATFFSMGEERGREEEEQTRAEMQRYREALHSMISAKSSSGESGEGTLGAVTYEISRSNGVHLQWQFLPVPAEMIKKGIVEAAFDVEAENFHYGAFAKTEDEIKEIERGDHFKAMLWSEAGEKIMVLGLNNNFKFDLQFGRGVLGKLLGLEKRRHWRDCDQTQEQETADRDLFKQMFEEFDFTEADGYFDTPATAVEPAEVMQV